MIIYNVLKKNPIELGHKGTHRQNNKNTPIWGYFFLRSKKKSVYVRGTEEFMSGGRRNWHKMGAFQFVIFTFSRLQ